MGATTLGLGLVGLTVPSDQIELIIVMQWLFVSGTMAVSLLLIFKRPENRFGYITGWLAIGFALTGVGQRLGAAAAADERFSAAATWVMLEGIGWSTFVLTMVILLPLWFPTGHAASRLWGVVGWTGGALASLSIFAIAASNSQCVVYDSLGVCQMQEPVPWGFLDRRWGEDLTFLLMLLGLPAVVGLVVRFVRSNGIERKQLKWYVASFVALVVAVTVGMVFDLNIDALTWPVTLLIPVSVCIAILRFRLYEIDRIISRTVTYAVVVGLLVGAVALLATLVGTRFDTPLVVAAITLAVAAAFNPLRRRVQKVVDRRFNRSRYDAERVMDGFARSLRDEVNSELVVDGWVEVVSETMEPVSVGVWVRG